MLKRTLFFNNPYHLSTKLRQLVITDKESRQSRSVPIEDIGFAVFEHPQITFTQSVIQLLSANNTAIVFCDEKHHPTSMLMHLDTHQVQTERFRAQVEASQPLRKQLWKQTIKAKLRNQGAVLDKTERSGEALRKLATRVKSGDPDNCEAQGSRRYWPLLFGEGFYRDRFGEEPNAALNYGYAILRAAVARALVGSGLLPALGIHHRNRYNSFCLADDIMEPYRPFVDQLVWKMMEDGMECALLGKHEKAELLQILTSDIFINKRTRPLMVGLTETTASLTECFAGTRNKIKYPSVG